MDSFRVSFACDFIVGNLGLPWLTFRMLVMLSTAPNGLGGSVMLRSIELSDGLLALGK